VWIDALCIIQNCNKDWENEAAKMAYVYSRAWLTISADLSKRSTDGCFNNSRRRRAWHPFDLNGEINGILSNGSTSKLFFFSPIVPDIEEPQRLRGSPLSGRAWTLQERLLSPRVLHYTSFGLIWECRSGFCAEDNIVDWNPSSKTASRILLELSDSSNHSDMEVLYNWYHVVLTMSYALRELTFSSDKLQAISGVAKVFHQRLQCPYLAGLWLKRLEIGLAWSRFGHRNRKDEVNNRPSWSWTSQIGTITWPLLKDELDSEFKSLIIIHRFEIELFNQNDPFGRTRGCLLTVSGLLKTMHVRKIGETAFKPKFSLFNLNENEALGEVILDKEGTDEFEISCLSLFCSISTFGSFSAYLLLLSPVVGQQLKYTRVGIAHITQVRGWELLGNPEISTIILL
jgi:hypothetical protein